MIFKKVISIEQLLEIYCDEGFYKIEDSYILMRVAYNMNSYGYKLYKDTSIINLEFNTIYNQYALIINNKFHFPTKQSIGKEEILRLNKILRKDN